MRLSKAIKKSMEEHKGLKLSKENLADLRKSRKKQNRAEFTLVSIQETRLNPKKDKSARRNRNSIPGYYNPRSTPSKYPYNPLITKAAK